MLVDTRLIEFLHRNSLTVNDFIYLWNLESKNNWNEEVFPPDKSKLLLLEFVDEFNQITVKTRKLIEEITSSFKINSWSNKDFDTWWANYPLSDEHSFFPMTRPLRVKKEECSILFAKILKNGYTLEQLLKALDREVTIKRNRSVDSNEMKFMPNSLNYLSGQYFIPWIEEEGQKALTNDAGDRFTVL